MISTLIAMFYKGLQRKKLQVHSSTSQKDYHSQIGTNIWGDIILWVCLNYLSAFLGN